jgi:hypothetical protein
VRLMTRWKFTKLVYKWWKMLIMANESDRMRAAELIGQHIQEICLTDIYLFRTWHDGGTKHEDQ